MKRKPSYEELAAKLAELEAVSRVIRNGEVDAVIGDQHVLMLRLKEVEDQLKRERDHLEKEVANRTRELRELSRGLIDGQEEERQAIGNELYDEVSQLLASALLLLEGTICKPDSRALVEARSEVKQALERINKLPPLLVPRLLQIVGLQRAIKHLVADYQFRTNIKVEFDHLGGLEKVPEKLALAIYRITQESLANVARHSKASEVKVHLFSLAGKLRLEVADNGTGFNPKAVYPSVGLTGMRERAQAVAGKLTIESNPGQGTRVAVEFPLSVTDKP